MTQTATITWDLPATLTDGTPIDPTTLAGVEVFLSADLGANFTLLGTVSPLALQQRIIPDLVEGDYTVRLVIRQLSGGVSAGINTSFKVGVATPGPVAVPNPVTNVVVTLT